jgi:hypothetical protein
VSDEYTLRFYQEGDEVEILKTFNRVFGDVWGEGFVPRTLEHWEWEFPLCPYGNRIALAFTDDGTCAAQYAGVVYPMTTAFGDCNFIHIADNMVHPDHRRGLKKKGLFVTAAYPWFDLCRDLGDAVLYGYPVPKNERIGTRYLEYYRLRVVDYLCRDLTDGSVEGPGDVEVTQVSSVPTDVDQLFARVAGEKNCQTRRTAEYLNWRYVMAPGDEYELLEARRHGRLCGFAVLRPVHEMVHAPGTNCDWIAPERDLEVMDALIAKATERGREHGRRRLLAVFANPSPEFANLLERGFDVTESTDFEERRLTHRIYHPQMTTEWLQENWWYTLGDSDLV